jgi:hypothetical protein
MYNSIVVQIFDSNSNLVCQFFNPLFGELEAPKLNVVEKVFALHVFQYDIVVVLVFEKINEANDVWVLTHFEDIDFSSLLINLNWLHVLFIDSFDGHFLSSLDMSG